MVDVTFKLCTVSNLCGYKIAMVCFMYCSYIMSYAVVQFINWGKGNSVMSIPEKWIYCKKNELWCYFPKTNQLSHIKNCTTPRGDWKKYVIKRLSKKPINSYTKALEKESEARFTSGIDTDSGAEGPVESKKKQNASKAGFN